MPKVIVSQPHLFTTRVCMSKPTYSHVIRVFALHHFYPKEEEDEFSKKVMGLYKHGYAHDFFLKQLIELYNLRFKDDPISFDYLTLYPTSEKNGLNANMLSLAKEFCKQVGLAYHPVLRRNKTIKKMHELHTFEERLENVKGSIDVLDDVNGKNILIMDNTTTTGISLIDAANEMIEKGAENVVGICLAVSATHQDSDWVDLNKTLKYSKIKQICKSPYVSEEKRRAWKEKNTQD